MLHRAPAAARTIRTPGTPTLARQAFAAARTLSRSKPQPQTCFTTAARRPAAPRALRREAVSFARGAATKAEPVTPAVSATKTEPVTQSVSPAMSKIAMRPPHPPPPATAHEDDKDYDMWAGVKSELRTIREVFDLSEVPRAAFVFGVAGLVPYVATSATTIYCCWEMTHAAAVGSGFIMSGGAAEALLHVLEPLQIGYGAVIISFLGAIHWGLEWAKYGGEVGYPRYMLGVIAPAIAWPTLLLSPNIALIWQFLGFTYMFVADSRASRKGWAPEWYTMYRFVLTLVVGVSLVCSLSGRDKIAHIVDLTPPASERLKELALQLEVSKMEEELRLSKLRKEEHA